LALTSLLPALEPTILQQLPKGPRGPPQLTRSGVRMDMKVSPRSGLSFVVMHFLRVAMPRPEHMSSLSMHACFAGTRCSSCSPGYYQLNIRCYSCGSSVDQTRDIVITIFVGVVAVILLALLVAMLRAVPLAHTMVSGSSEDRR
jgi:hypothetical protein